MKSTIWIAGIFVFFFLYLQLICQRHCQVPCSVQTGTPLCRSPLCSHSFCQGAAGVRAGSAHSTWKSLFLSFVYCEFYPLCPPHLSDPLLRRSLVESESKAIILSTFLHFVWKMVPVCFLHVICPNCFSSSGPHDFSTFQKLFFVTCFQTPVGASSFWYSCVFFSFVFVTAAKFAIIYGLGFVFTT